jgi:hypothetical protein
MSVGAVPLYVETNPCGQENKGFLPICFTYKRNVQCKYVCDVKKKEKKKRKEEKKEECGAVREREKRKEKGCFFLITSIRDWKVVYGPILMKF